MLESGLINSYAGRMWICGILAFLAWLIVSGWTILMGLREPFAHRTYTDPRTGVTRYSMSRYWFRVARIVVGIPLAAMSLMTAWHLTAMGVEWVAVNWWVIPIGLAACAVAVGAWVLARQRAPQERPQMVALPVDAPMPAVASEAIGWSLPDLDGHWQDER